ncbi:hypothetical protein HDU84_006346 [Entophlyctis sp. JEL0112]|nr:hypothetical protein HDU84_006346 [Entophlyctis sp. JEL0112]
MSPCPPSNSPSMHTFGNVFSVNVPVAPGEITSVTLSIVSENLGLADVFENFSGSALRLRLVEDNIDLTDRDVVGMRALRRHKVAAFLKTPAKGNVSVSPVSKYFMILGEIE